jgi:hypothetical protein
MEKILTGVGDFGDFVGPSLETRPGTASAGPHELEPVSVSMSHSRIYSKTNRDDVGGLRKLSVNAGYCQTYKRANLLSQN